VDRARRIGEALHKRKAGPADTDTSCLKKSRPQRLPDHKRPAFGVKSGDCRFKN
jgi:hypothetical protein